MNKRVCSYLRWAPVCGWLLGGLLLPSMAAASSAGDAMVCVPTADGKSWDCGNAVDRPLPRRSSDRAPATTAARPTPADAAAPAVTAPTPAPVERSRSATEATQATEGPTKVAALPLSEPRDAQSLDPITGLSLDPEDWYVPATPRAADAEHQLPVDLAASLFVAGPTGQCLGSYTQPSWPQRADAALAELPIIAQADELSTVLDVAASLQGNVTIEQGNRRVLAMQGELDYATRVVTFPQGVRLEQPGSIMQGQQATVYLNSKQADLQQAQFVLTEAQMRGAAAQILQGSEGRLTLSDSSFTRCEPGDDGWLLSARDLVIEEDAVFGTARGTVLRMKSVPVFYTPYLKFPVSDERVSGFLFPNLSYSDEDGVDLSVPYYLNLAPNYDATVIPRYISDRGAGMELELRHRNRWQSTVLSGALLPSDDLYNGFVDREDYESGDGASIWPSFDPADRWLGAVNHQGRIGPFRTFVDYAAVSDRDYFRDLGTDLAVSAQRELERRGGITYRAGGLRARLWAQSFQRIDEIAVDEYQRLPELELAYERALVGPLSLEVGSVWTEFDRDTQDLDGLAAVTGSRMHLEPRLHLDFARAWGALNVTGGYRYTAYDLEQDARAGGLQLADDSPDRGIGMASVDGNLVFERPLSGFGGGLVQTLEPRLYYLWQEYDDQAQLPLFDASRLTFGYSQLFRDNRFSGLDRIGDADQVSLGVTTRFLSRRDGREYFRFSLGEIFYFADRRVNLTDAVQPADTEGTSALAAEMSAALMGDWRAVGNIVWDERDNQVDEGGLGLQYRRDNRHLFNIGYRSRVDEDIEQTDISLYWPISRDFAIMGRWNYDLVSGRTIEGFGGLEYNDCCLQVRLMARRFLDSPTARNFEDIEADDGVFLQVVFKGLAGVGTQVESVLERGIRGYRSPDPRAYFSNP